MIQRMLAIWSLIPLPFLNPVWTFGSSWFTSCWSLSWRGHWTWVSSLCKPGSCKSDRSSSAQSLERTLSVRETDPGRHWTKSQASQESEPAQALLTSGKQEAAPWWSVQFNSVQSLSCVRLWNPWTAAGHAFLFITQLPKLTHTHVHWVSYAIQPSHLCRPLLLPPSIFPSVRVFSNGSVLHIRWPKYWGFSFSISPSNEYSGLISFRMNRLDVLAVQGTLKSLLQHHGSKVTRCHLHSCPRRLKVVSEDKQAFSHSALNVSC